MFSEPQQLVADGIVGTRDGLGAGDHDQPHHFGRQPRTYRLERDAARGAGYRRLVIAILGLDVETLARGLRADAGRATWVRHRGRVSSACEELRPTP